MTFRLEHTADGLTLGTFPHLRAVHTVAGRTGGVSEGAFASLNLGPRSGDSRERVAANVARLRAALGLEHRRFLAPRQVHGAHVSIHRRGEPCPATGVLEGDAVVSDDPNVALMVLAADCCALLLHEPRRGVVAAVHAGWRGTALNIAASAVLAMQDAFRCRPANVVAAIGPAIGPCCYEVGRDVAAQVAEAARSADVFAAVSQSKAMLDISRANALQLQQAGVPPDRIVTAGICTACRTDLFFSHRREGEPTGRFGGAIALPEPDAPTD